MCSVRVGGSHTSPPPEHLELLIDRVNDLVEFRIDAVLQDMSGAVLCVLPDDPLPCEEFVQTTKVSPDNQYPTIC